MPRGLATLGQILGLEHLTTTMRYLHPREEEVQGMVEEMWQGMPGGLKKGLSFGVAYAMMEADPNQGKRKCEALGETGGGLQATS